jgi:hypothetical protein
MRAFAQRFLLNFGEGFCRVDSLAGNAFYCAADECKRDCK